MYYVTRTLFSPDDENFTEYLFVGKKGILFWTSCYAEATPYEDLVKAKKMVAYLSFLYGFDIFNVSIFPSWESLDEDA